MAASEVQHGTLNAYRYHACRCADCRAANTANWRRYIEQGAGGADRYSSRRLVDRRWVTQAACRGIDPELFYASSPEGARAGNDEHKYEEARALCAGCPVRGPCLEHANTPPYELMGMWGGRSPRERQRLRRRQDKKSDNEQERRTA